MLQAIRSAGLAILVGSLAIVAAPAQLCPGGVLLKNDKLAAVPSGPLAVSVIPGLCPGEASGAVFTISGTPFKKVTKVATGFGASGGQSGKTAVVNIEIYDGVQFNGASATLGPKIFDYAAAAGGNLQIVSTGINEVNLSSYDIEVGHNGNTKFVVAFRMVTNTNGNCTTGYNANFITDNTQPGLFGCDHVITPIGKNLMFILGQGWVDPALATVSGIGLCPLFYSGNWLLRACVTDVVVANPLQVVVSGSRVPLGGSATLTFLAPGYASTLYFAAASFGTSPGIPVSSGTPPVNAVFPLNPDALFNLSISTPALFSNFVGVIGLNEQATGSVFVPANPILSGLQFYVAFATLPAAPAPYGISNPAQVLVQ